MSIQVRFTHAAAAGGNPATVTIFPRPIDYSFQMTADRELRLINLSPQQSLELQFDPLLRLAFDPVAPARILLYGAGANEVTLTLREELGTLEGPDGNLFHFNWGVYEPGNPVALAKTGGPPGVGDFSGQR